MKWKTFAGALAIVLMAAAPARAQWAFGVQGSYGFDVDGPAIGVRAVAPISTFMTTEAGSVLARTEFVGSFDYFFPDATGFNYWEINAGGNINFPVEGASFLPYAGLGLDIAHASTDNCPVGADCGDTKAALNLQGGLKFPLTSLTPYVEGRFELRDNEQFVLTAGLLFGGH